MSYQQGLPPPPVWGKGGGTDELLARFAAAVGMSLELH